MSGYNTDAELALELGHVFHPNPTDEETQRGCEIIETLMKREKARLMEAAGKEDADRELIRQAKQRRKS